MLITRKGIRLKNSYDTHNKAVRYFDSSQSRFPRSLSDMLSKQWCRLENN